MARVVFWAGPIAMARSNDFSRRRPCSVPSEGFSTRVYEQHAANGMRRFASILPRMWWYPMAARTLLPRIRADRA